MAGALIMMALGGLLIWVSWRNRQKVQASAAWPYVAGRITAASVREDYTRGDADTADTRTYVPVVQYEYQVSGQLFRGNRISFQDRGFDTSRKALAALQQFSVGAPVWVFHDPADPRNAVLERKAYHNGLPMVLGSLLLVGGVVLLCKS